MSPREAIARALAPNVWRRKDEGVESYSVGVEVVHSLNQADAVLRLGMPFQFGSAIWPGLAKLAEEMGEAQQEIGKLMMTGGNPAHWSGDLRIRMMDELADVKASICFVETFNFTDEEIEAINARTARKSAKFLEWHEHPELDIPPNPEWKPGQ